jgi:para-aminobenzoate synthetase
MNAERGVDKRLLAARVAVTAAVEGLLATGEPPVVVAVDGPSGAGKSTLAALVAERLDAALIPLDDFFAADVPEVRWGEMTVEEQLRRVFHWGRVRESVLKPLLAGRPARWHAFDFVGGQRPDGTYGMQEEAKVRAPATVIILEGAYSTSPPLADLVDLAVLVDAPVEVRHARQAAREDPEFLAKWHRVWDALEDYYFNRLRPRSSFDLVVELG